MGQVRFLSAIHDRVRRSAESGAILDAYRLADELIAEDLSYPISRKEAVDTVIAAGVVYGAPLLLDPEDTRERSRQIAGRLAPVSVRRLMGV